MTLGEKLRDCRKRAGLSQEALAEKLHVSRQAITKWECGGGLPDVENLQRIAALFGVTVDELLREEDSIAPSVLREELDLAQYEDTGRYHARQDAAVKAHFPNAGRIIPLIRRKKLSKTEQILDFLTQPGVFHLADVCTDQTAYYLVEEGERQRFVHVAETYIESSPLNPRFTEKWRLMDGQYFVKAAYTL